ADALQSRPGVRDGMRARIAAAGAARADPGLYARDRAGFDRATRELAQAEAELAAAEERWLELEILREEIEGSG
ncbi:MAG: ABC transporter ATP-binding protein, partial [Alphaproteobacteria bacterium]